MLCIPRRLYEAIIVHCRNEYPKEACGILAGKDGMVEQGYPMTNVDESPISYQMDPKEQLQVMKQMRAANEQMLAIYHSHTASAAYPSPVDVARASEPGVAMLLPDVCYVVVSLADRQHPEIKNYKITEGRVMPDDLQLLG